MAAPLTTQTVPLTIENIFEKAKTGEFFYIEDINLITELGNDTMPGRWVTMNCIERFFRYIFSCCCFMDSKEQESARRSIEALLICANGVSKVALACEDEVAQFINSLSSPSSATPHRLYKRAHGSTISLINTVGNQMVMFTYAKTRAELRITKKKEQWEAAKEQEFQDRLEVEKRIWGKNHLGGMIAGMKGMPTISPRIRRHSQPDISKASPQEVERAALLIPKSPSTTIGSPSTSMSSPGVNDSQVVKALSFSSPTS